MSDRVGDELVAVSEVRVEAAVSEAGFLHELGDAHPSESAGAKRSRRGGHDALADLALVPVRVSHDGHHAITHDARNATARQLW